MVNLMFELNIDWKEKDGKLPSQPAMNAVHGGKLRYDKFADANKAARGMSLSPIVCKVRMQAVCNLGSFIDGEMELG